MNRLTRYALLGFAGLIASVTAFAEVASESLPAAVEVTQENSAPATAKVYFIKTDAGPGAATSYVSIDGVDAERRLKNGQYMEFTVTPGDHIIETRFPISPVTILPKKEKIKFSIEAGETKYFVLQLRSKMLTSVAVIMANEFIEESEVRGSHLINALERVDR